MKSTGIVRKVDDLGRIVLPIELRRTLDIHERDSIEIFVDGNQIVLKKYSPACIFCGRGGGCAGIQRQADLPEVHCRTHRQGTISPLIFI